MKQILTDLVTGVAMSYHRWNHASIIDYELIAGKENQPARKTRPENLAQKIGYGIFETLYTQYRKL